MTEIDENEMKEVEDELTSLPLVGWAFRIIQWFLNLFKRK